MSQAGIVSTSGGPSPPSVPTSFTTDSGTAVPVANILNVLGNDTTANDADGLSTSASGDTVTVLLTNRIQGTATTVGATSATAASFNLGATPASYMFEFLVSGYDAVGNQATGYWFVATARTNGVTAVVVGTNEQFQEDPALGASDVHMTAAGNVVSLIVTGSAGETISWNTVGYYVRST